jgi:hypothetical protein
MNIGPTQTVPVVAEDRSSDSSTRKITPARPSLEDHPAMGPSLRRNIESGLSIPAEVVKVHSDTSSGSPILVYEFVDAKSGSLVFQIPSDQMLSLVQDIRQRLQRMAAKTSPGGEAKPEE